MTVRARFDGKVFVPIDPLPDVPPDQIVELDVRACEPARRGSPAFLRQLMQQGPTLEPGDAAALEAAIEAGRRPVRYEGLFDQPRRP